MSRVKGLQLKKFSDRLQSLYSSWNKHLSRQWKDAKAIVVCTPPSPRYTPDPELDTTKFFEWLFGDWVSKTYIVFSPAQIYVVCGEGSSWYSAYDAELIRSFAQEAKRTVGVDFVVKDKGCGRTLKETLTRIADGFPGPVLPSGAKGKIAVGFIGDREPEGGPTDLMEWKDVTDAFYGLAGIK